MSLKKKSIKRKSSPKRRSPRRKATISRQFGCVPSTLKKYTERPGPPYPANECPFDIKRGNLGGLWKSTPNYKGVFTWKKI